MASAAGWQVLLPPGFSYVSDTATTAETRPLAGATGLLEWSWTTVPTSPVTFTFSLNSPSTVAGAAALSALGVLRLEGMPAAIQLLAQPEPLPLTAFTPHSADLDRNFRISLLELTRVIELYNTRDGANRTGCYRLDPAGEDGYNPDPLRLPSATVTLAQYHSADVNRDAKLGLLELTRVIELYNTRAGSGRTGQYRVQLGTEDGFAPGP
jgi:hypothetical protein